MSFIKGIASIGAAMLIGFSAQSARAAYVLDLAEQGSNVVATGSGAIDLTGLASTGLGAIVPFMFPFSASISTGDSAEIDDADSYTGFTGPMSFGPGDLLTDASSASGDVVAILGGFNELFVPLGYVSDSPLSDTSTYLSQTFNSLGVTPGAYEWTWGTGADQNFTLVIGTPEPSTWAMMFMGFAGLGLVGYQGAGRRRRVARGA